MECTGIIETIITILSISCWSWLFCTRFVDADEFLSFIPGSMRWILTGDSSVRQLDGIAGSIYKALIGCPKCHAGWMAIFYSMTTMDHFSIAFIVITMALTEILTVQFKN